MLIMPGLGDRFAVAGMEATDEVLEPPDGDAPATADLHAGDATLGHECVHAGTADPQNGGCLLGGEEDGIGGDHASSLQIRLWLQPLAQAVGPDPVEVQVDPVRLVFVGVDPERRAEAALLVGDRIHWPVGHQLTESSLALGCDLRLPPDRGKKPIRTVR